MKTVTLEYGNMKASIAPEKGSNLFSLQYKNNELLYTDQTILDDGGFTGCYILFPTPNRVKDFSYEWNHTRYQLQKFGKPVTTHHQLVFDQPFEIVAQTPNTLTTALTINTSSHLFPGYPFPCTLTLEYKLHANRIRITYTVRNNGKQTLPFGFGLHPHFRRLSGNDKTKISLVGNSVMNTIGDTLLPDGRCTAVTQKPTPVGLLNLDHVFTDIPKGAFAAVDYSTLGFRIELHTSGDFTHLVCWSGHPEAICIENQTCSTDAINLYNRGFTKESHLLIVEPQATHSGWIEYAIL